MLGIGLGISPVFTFQTIASDWILYSGVWADSGIWIDSQNWNDN